MPRAPRAAAPAVLAARRTAAALPAARRLAVLGAAAALVAGCGSASPRLQQPPPAPQRLPIGLTEANPHLMARGAQPPTFAPWRDRLVALRPTYVRIFVDWAAVDGRLDARAAGCMREVLPCAPYAGLRDQLRALAARRLADPGRWRVLLTVYGVPDRYAQPAGGCERTDASPRARAITAAGIAAYRRLLGEMIALAHREGIEIPYVSPWNEPNHPSLISPQRARCDRDAPSRVPGVYARLAAAAQDVLQRAPGDQRLVLGELAGYTDPTPRTTTIAEFVAALPDNLACAAVAWSVHDYARATGVSTDAVAALERALARRACTARTPIWITETGAGRRLRGTVREADLAAACRAMTERLTRWDADPRVAAVFQYTFREDPAFPVGLADAQLTRLYPTYDVWRAWSTAPVDGPPPTPACT
ncbi:MAG TPA: hypothetical protein VFZ89_00290 [Solirubrobacteraceae bacterium]